MMRKQRLTDRDGAAGEVGDRWQRVTRPNCHWIVRCRHCRQLPVRQLLPRQETLLADALDERDAAACPFSGTAAAAAASAGKEVDKGPCLLPGTHPGTFLSSLQPSSSLTSLDNSLDLGPDL